MLKEKAANRSLGWGPPHTKPLNCCDCLLKRSRPFSTVVYIL